MPPTPAPAAALSADGLSLRYDDRTIVADLDLTITPGKVTVILGANASGKSTVLKALARLLAPASGRVRLGDDDVAQIPSKQFARAVGLLPQSSTAPGGITVGELVARGRYPHQRLLQQWSPTDAEAVRRALAATALHALADRPVDELSGGQRQRAWIALLLAQDTPTMLLDEPTTYLDIAHQLELLELVRRLNRTEGRTIVMVLHDLDQACRYADELVVLKDGRIVASGPPATTMTEELVATAFGIKALVESHPVTGAPVVLPLESILDEGEEPGTA